MKDLEEAKRIHKVDVIMNRQRRELFLTQEQYMGKILQKFRMINVKPVVIPLASHFKSSLIQSPKLEEKILYEGSSLCKCGGKHYVCYDMYKV